MTFDSCGSCRKAMAGPSPQLFRAMLSFLSGSFVQEAQLIAALAIVKRCCDHQFNRLGQLLVCEVMASPVISAQSLIPSIELEISPSCLGWLHGGMACVPASSGI